MVSEENNSTASKLDQDGAEHSKAAPQDHLPSSEPQQKSPLSASAVNEEDLKPQGSPPAEDAAAPPSNMEQPFVNHGLAFWEKNRRKWRDHSQNVDGSKIVRRATPINADAIIDVIFTSPRQMRQNGGKGRRFPQNVPLPQLIDILQDLWEAEGLDV